MHTQEQKFLSQANFADSTLKFKGFKVFCTFLCDVYNRFDQLFFLTYSSILYGFTAPQFLLNSLYYNQSKVNFMQNIVKIPRKINKYDKETQVKECFLYHSALCFYTFYKGLSCKGHIYILHILCKCVANHLSLKSKRFR